MIQLPSFISPQRRAVWLQAVVAFAFMGFAALLVRVALKEPLITAGLLYVTAFWWVAWKRPHIALLLVFAACPFQSDVSGGGFAKFSIAEVNIALTVPIFILHMLVRKRLPTLGPIALPVLLYFGVCGYSSWENWRGQDALLSLVQMFLYFVVVVSVFASFVARMEQLRAALYALFLVGIFLAIAGVATSFTFFGLNKNGLGASLSCALLVGVELWLSEKNIRHKKWLIAALAVVAAALLLSLSRGSWLGFLAGTIAIFGLRRQWRSLGQLTLALLPLLALCWFLLPSDSRDYATGFGKDRYNIQARYQSIDLAQTIFYRNPVYGEGVGLRKEYDATNTLLMTLAETGVFGLAFFLLIHGALFGMIFQTQRRISPTHPHFSFLTVGAALILCQFCHGLVDHYWSRGAIMAAWAAAGMAVGVYSVHRNRPPLGELS